jgi:hypothetical protein
MRLAEAVDITAEVPPGLRAVLDRNEQKIR